MKIIKSHQFHQLVNALPIIWFFSGFLLVSNGQTYMAYFLLLASLYNIILKKSSFPNTRKLYLFYPVLAYTVTLFLSYSYTKEFWPVIRTSLYFIPYILTTSLALETIRKVILILPATAVFILSSYFYIGTERYLDYTGLNPIPLATTLVFYLCTLFFSTDLFTYTKKQKVMIILGIIALIGSIIKSETRGAWLSLISILPIFLVHFTSKKSRIVKKNLLLSSIIIIMVSTPFLYHTLNERIERTLSEIHSISTGQYSTSIGTRLELWKTSFEIISEGYYLLPTKEKEINSYFKEKSERNEITQSAYYHSDNAHNQYLNSWLRTGLIGLLSVIALSIFPLIGVIKHYGLRHSGLISIQTLTLIVSGLTELPLTQISAYQAFLMSLLIGYMILEKKE